MGRRSCSSWSKTILAESNARALTTRRRRDSEAREAWGPSTTKQESQPFQAGFFAGRTGLEPAASGVTGRRYNQLNYRPVSGKGGLHTTGGALLKRSFHERTTGAGGRPDRAFLPPYREARARCWRCRPTAPASLGAGGAGATVVDAALVLLVLGRPADWNRTRPPSRVTRHAPSGTFNSDNC